jgi:sirohydrochlorin cobaltochelatase
VFGRGHEEVLACVDVGLPWSAVAAPALAGVPVTHRGIAQDVTIVPGHRPPGHPESLVDWQALARIRGTLVLLMAVDTVDKIAACLVERGRDPGTPVLLVQNAGDPAQRSFAARLDDVGQVLATNVVLPPAVVVVGSVVSLRHVIE